MKKIVSIWNSPSMDNLEQARMFYEGNSSFCGCYQYWIDTEADFRIEETQAAARLFHESA